MSTAEVRFADDPFLAVMPSNAFFANTDEAATDQGIKPGGEGVAWFDQSKVLETFPTQWTARRIDTLWVSLQASARLLAAQIDGRAEAYNSIEQLNLSRLLALAEISAAWILVILHSGRDLDTEFCLARLISVERFSADLAEYMAARI